MLKMIFGNQVDHQFGCGISKMVGPIKKDFWPRINTLEGKKKSVDGSQSIENWA